MTNARQYPTPQQHQNPAAGNQQYYQGAGTANPQQQQGLAQQSLKRQEPQSAQARKKKVLDRALPRKIDTFVPEAKLYTELCDFEKRLDATIIRKRQDIQESSSRPLKTKRMLRIFLANLAANQFAEDKEAGGELEVDPSRIPSWTLQIQGRLLDPPNSRKLSNQPKFSTFVKTIVVQLDRDPSLFADGNIIEFRKTPSTPEFDGIEVKRRGDSDVNAKIFIYLDHSPEKFILSEPLKELLGVGVDSKANIIMSLWQYIKIHKLQDVDDKRFIKLDEALTSIFRTQRIGFIQIPELILPHLRPCDPVQIDFTIKIDQEYTLSNIAYDVEVEVDDPVTAQMNRIALTGDPNTQKEIADLNEMIAREVEEINAYKLKREFMLAFAKDPVSFLNEWVASQSRDLEVILGDTRFNTEESRRSSFYCEPWVRDAVFHYMSKSFLPNAVFRKEKKERKSPALLLKPRMSAQK
ncbi:SWI SNF- matrix-associated actin-dependent regulator of chromatin sub D [Dinochytrium kinnereticum]|nr:SWI SNF- matrix-associated actin-dependent regulator of chromatin sub D [Dinochytrium kinnereticum]